MKIIQNKFHIDLFPPSHITLRMFSLCLFDSHIVRDFLGCLWYNKILFTNSRMTFCLPRDAEEEKTITYCELQFIPIPTFVSSNDFSE
jgi:hypothetical protein